jgi:hypothetical protein
VGKSENIMKKFIELSKSFMERTGSSCKSAEMITVHRFVESQKPWVNESVMILTHFISSARR